MGLRTHLQAFQKEGAEVLAIHCECPPQGTRILAGKLKLGFPLANDDRLRVVGKYSVTSTYLIDRQGIIRARWLDSVHKRVDGATILKALQKLNEPGKRSESQAKKKGARSEAETGEK